MPWEAIKYVTSGFTLVAFLALAALFVYQHYVRTPERLIRLVDPDKRYPLVKRELEDQAGARKFRMTTTVLGAIFFVSLIGAISSFQADSSKRQTTEKTGVRTDPLPSPSTVPTGPAVAADAPKPVLPRTALLHEVHISVYDGREQPRFAIDRKPATAGEYESGVASFRLPAGPHEIIAEYSDRTCTATFLVPAASLIAAQCSLK
jgi:hypothetical protein